MRVNVHRVGGFAGLDEDLGTIATESLSPTAAARLHRIVASLEGSADSELGADIPAYQVDIASEDGDERLLISDTGDDLVNPALLDLLGLMGSLPPQ